MVVLAEGTIDIRDGLFLADEAILRQFFRLQEARRQRIWVQRLLHPETMQWAKKGEPPPITPTKQIRIEELGRLGFGEEWYLRMLGQEVNAKTDLEDLAQAHPLWEHFKRLKGFGPYLCGCFVAAGGNIRRVPTVSAFWKGMGLDLLPDGSVPRRVRGRKDTTRSIPALPHVTLVGEQIRQQFLRSGGKLYECYRAYRVREPADKQKLFAHKSALRKTQKLLYACLWREWRLAYGLAAPEPYAFAILNHDQGSLVDIRVFYDR